MAKCLSWLTGPVIRWTTNGHVSAFVTTLGGSHSSQGHETHPLSDADGGRTLKSCLAEVAHEPKGSYAREALLDGLAMAESGITNAYQFGLVGATDTHVGASSLDESNFFSKVGLLDADGQRRGSVPMTSAQAEVLRSAGRVNVQDIDGNEYVSGAYETWSASGLTGVWAGKTLGKPLCGVAS